MCSRLKLGKDERRDETRTDIRSPETQIGLRINNNFPL